MALAVKAKTPGAARYIIQSVTFIVDAKILSKNEITGRFISPTFDKAMLKITTNIIIGIISACAKAAIGF